MPVGDFLNALVENVISITIFHINLQVVGSISAKTCIFASVLLDQIA